MTTSEGGTSAAEDKIPVGGEENSEETSVPGSTNDGAREERATEPAGETVKRAGMSSGEYLLIGLSLLLILLAVGGGMFFWARYGASLDGRELAQELPQVSPYLLKPFFLPLAEKKAGPERFLSVSISLNLSDGHTPKEIGPIREQVRGVILAILLSAVTRDLEHANGKKALRDRMVTSINRSLGDELVTGVRFSEMEII